MADPVELSLLSQTSRPCATPTLDDEDRTSHQRQPSSHSSATPDAAHRTSSSIVPSLFNEPLTDDSSVAGPAPGRTSDDGSSSHSAHSKNRNLGSKRRISTTRWFSKLRLWCHSDRVVPWLIIGSYILAIILATLHYVFFTVLDGRTTKGSFLQRQSTVNAISLLTVTMFRALIVYSVGASFAQYMWQLFRKHAFKIRLIENLFQLRANIWELANFNIIRRAPLLFLIALISWLVPLAMVYPPGALTIQTEVQWGTTSTNVSTFNSEYQNLGRFLPSIFEPEIITYNDGKVFAESYLQPFEQSRRLAVSVLSNGAIADPLLPRSEDCTYELEFLGPLFRCAVKTVPSEVIFHPTSPDAVIYSIGWTEFKSGDYQNRTNFTSQWTFQSTASTPLGVYTLPDGRYMLVNSDLHQSCRAHTATYTVGVTFKDGIQTITKSLKDEKELNPIVVAEAFRGDNQSWSYLLDHHQPPDGSLWENGFLTWRQEMNALCVMHLIALSLKYTKTQIVMATWDPAGKYVLENGTKITLQRVVWDADQKGSVGSFLETSVFNDKRFSYNEVAGEKFEPSTDLDLSEARLNDALFNLTMSFLSLGVWYDTLDVNASYIEAVYRFSDPLQFFLPYCLCIGLTGAIMTIGLLALRRNGVAATDGGFVQIVTTTTGDTEMRRAALPGCLGGRRNAPKELMDMKVRFGELESECHSVRRAGFGTVDETVPLRRRVAYGKDLAD